MIDRYVPQPPLIDAQGNINIHGREGISVPVKWWTGYLHGQGVSPQLDLSTYSMALEVDVVGVADIPLVVDPLDPLGLRLTIPSLQSAGILVTPGNYPRFALRDTTGAFPVVRWEGRFIVRGWE